MASLLRRNCHGGLLTNFVRGEATLESWQTSSHKSKQRIAGNLSGDQAKKFYEELVSEPSHSYQNLDGCDSRQSGRSSLKNAGRHSTRNGSKRTADSSSTAKTSKRRKYSGNMDSPCSSDFEKSAKDEKRTAKEFQSTAKQSGATSVNKFLQLAQDGEVDKLREFIRKYNVDVNATDSYNWTALMCASYSGHTQTVNYLLDIGARWREIRDTRGKTAVDLARAGGHVDIVHLLENFQKSKHKSKRRKHSDSSKRDGSHLERDKSWCDVCGQEYFGDERKHFSSTVHQFKSQHKIQKTLYQIPETNIGYQLMLKKGWDEERGLGKEGSGQKFPVKTVLKRDREGLGSGKTPKPRVTHFSPYDMDAVKRKPVTEPQERAPRKMTKQQRKKKEQQEKAWERDFRMSFLTE